MSVDVVVLKCTNETSNKFYVAVLDNNINRSLTLYGRIGRAAQCRLVNHSLNHSLILRRISEKIGKGYERVTGDHVCAEISKPSVESVIFNVKAKLGVDLDLNLMPTGRFAGSKPTQPEVEPARNYAWAGDW